MRGYCELGRHAVALVKSFFRSERANTALIFAMTAATMLTTAGAGIDLARAMMVKARLGAALDAAALAVGTTNGLSSSQLQSLAQTYFNANYPTGALGQHNPVLVAVNGQHITLSVSGSVDTTLLQVMHIDRLNLSVSNEVVRAVTKLRVALVLDNTGSMSQTDSTGTSKISALKTATHQLLNQLQSAAVNTGDVQVSIIPFALDVNVGTANVNATWIDWTDWNLGPPVSLPANWSTVKGGSTCPFGTSSNPNISPYGFRCRTAPGSTTLTNTIPSSGTYNGYICPGPDSGTYHTGRIGHEYNGCWTSVKRIPTCSSSCAYDHNWITNNHSTWTGCVMDRNQSNDASNITPVAGNTNTMYPAENNNSCVPIALTGLGYNWSSLSSMVDAMTPNGSTNQTIGMVWGWQALTQGNPLNAPAQDPTIQNVIVLLSDGMNTQDRWYGDGSATSSQVDARMSAACANAKAAGIRIYTVLVMAGNSSVLQACATDSQKYFSLNTAGAIVTAFNSIGTELANLHLAR